MALECETCRWSWVLLPLTVLWLIGAGVLTLKLWPELPGSSWGWFLLVAFGPSLYVAARVWIRHRRWVLERRSEA